MKRLLLYSLMLFTCSANAQWFGRMNITTDAYSIGNIDRSKITQIYVDEGGLNENLALLPYIQKIRLRLYDLGFSVTKSGSSANFILKFEVFSAPVVRSKKSYYTLEGESKTIEKKTKDGKKETITIEGEDRSIPIIDQELYYEKIIRMKLYQVQSDRLIWQAESTIDNREESHQQYAHLLVYDALRYFLNTTPQHPIENVYSRRNRRHIQELFTVTKY